MVLSVWRVRANIKPWVDPQACRGCCQRFIFEDCPDECQVVKEYLIKNSLLFVQVGEARKQVHLTA